MAKNKKNFLKGKMNKDLDDRILPPGEYRDARNLAITRSEGSKVGALENVLGNDLIQPTSLGNYKCTAIGYYVDKQFSRTVVFATDYVDSSASGVDNFAPPNSQHFIYLYDHITQQTSVLVTGVFLNFSKRSNIIGVSRIEEMLFWTDDRNQPRKINLTTALANKTGSVNVLSNYYKNEDSISVATYAPFNPISLLNIDADQSAAGSIKSTMTNPAQALLPDGSANPDSDPTFAGDKNYLKDKFVRFSYRFQFDDGEYSLMAPFTQIAFIPKQNGYFLAEALVDPPTTNIDDWSTDSQQAYRSTVVQFMENNVTQIILNILFETTNPSADFKIKNVEILYKESDEIAIKVVETIPIATVEQNMSSNFNTKVYSYKYISTQPIKTLPQDQSTRVYDMVPVRAKAQELISNRIVYGNYRDKKSPPAFLDYQLAIALKQTVNTDSNSQIEYPNHTLKQNRTYQIGIVLSDRYGRESSVILSNNEDGTTFGAQNFSADTIYGGYTTFGFTTLEWPGNSLLTMFNTIIPFLSSTEGYGGVYKDDSYGVDEVKQITNAGTGYVDATDVATTTDFAESQGSGLTVDITESSTVAGTIERVVVNNPGTNYRSGETITITGGNGDAKIKITVGPPNPLGWHSWKIVVKQTEQEYYNVYMPGVLSGYPNENGTTTPYNWLPTNEDTVTSNIVLTNDNINKVPRDLNEVGPDQKQYRSTIGLYARVQPINNSDASTGATSLTYSEQFTVNAENLIDVVNISSLLDSNFNTLINEITEVNTSTVETLQLIYDEFYASETNPLIARLNGSQQFGVTATNISSNSFGLGVAETEPFVSNLDIYYETSTTGLVRDLNTSIINNEGGDVPASFGPLPIEDLWDQNESMCAGTTVTPFMDVLNYYGEVMDNIDSAQLNLVTIAGIPVTGYYSIEVVNNQVQVTLQTPIPFDTTNPVNNIVNMYVGIITSDGNYGEVIITGEILNTVPSFKERWEQDGCSVPDRYASNPTPGVARIQDLITFQLNNAWGSLNQGGQISTIAEDEDQGYGLALGANSYWEVSEASFNSTGAVSSVISDVAANPEYELFDEVRIDTFFPENGLCCSAPLDERTRGLSLRVHPDDQVYAQLSDDPDFNNPVPMFVIKDLTQEVQKVEIIDGGSGYTSVTFSQSYDQAQFTADQTDSPVTLTNQIYSNNLYNVATLADDLPGQTGTIGEGSGLRVNIEVDTTPGSPTQGQVVGLQPGRPIQFSGEGYRSGDVVRIIQTDNNGNIVASDALLRITTGGYGLYIDEDISVEGVNSPYGVALYNTAPSSSQNEQMQNALDLGYDLPLTDPLGQLLNTTYQGTIEEWQAYWASQFPQSEYPSYYDDAGNFIGSTYMQQNPIGTLNFGDVQQVGNIKPQPPVSDPEINNPVRNIDGQWIGLRPQGGDGQLKIYTIRVQVTDQPLGSPNINWQTITSKYMRTDITNIGSTRYPRYFLSGIGQMGYAGFNWNFEGYDSDGDGMIDGITYLDPFYVGDLSDYNNTSGSINIWGIPGLPGTNFGSIQNFQDSGGVLPGPAFYQYKHIQNRISTQVGEGLSQPGSVDQFGRNLKVLPNTVPYYNGNGNYPGSPYVKNSVTTGPIFDFGGEILYLGQQQDAPITALDDVGESIHVGGEPVKFKLPEELVNMPVPPTIKLKGYLGGYNPYGSNAWNQIKQGFSGIGNGQYTIAASRNPLIPNLYPGFNSGINSAVNTGTTANIISKSPFSTPWPEFTLVVGNRNDDLSYLGGGTFQNNQGTGGTGIGSWGDNQLKPTIGVEYTITTRSFLYLDKPDDTYVTYQKTRTLSNVGNTSSSVDTVITGLANGNRNITVPNPALTNDDPIVLGMRVFPSPSSEGSAPIMTSELVGAGVTVQEIVQQGAGSVTVRINAAFNDLTVGSNILFVSQGLSTNIENDESLAQIQAGAYIRSMDASATDNTESTFDLTLNYSNGLLDDGEYSIETSLGQLKIREKDGGEPVPGNITAVGLQWSAKNLATIPISSQGFYTGFDYGVQLCSPGTMAMYLDIDFS